MPTEMNPGPSAQDDRSLHQHPTGKVRRMLRECSGFIFDLDGTIYLGDELIPGADRLVRGLRQAGKSVAFLSNKPIARRESYARKLRNLGVACEDHEVINSSLVLARYLQRTAPGAHFYPIAEEPVVEDLRDHGLVPCERPEEIEVVVVSWDREVNYEKLRVAYQAAVNGAMLVGTNPDRTCPMPGYDLPDAACMIAAVEACTEKKVEPVVGKPSRIMLEEVLALLKLPAHSCVMVGDRCGTDMVMAENTGLRSVLVLSGVTGETDLEDRPVHPDVVLESVAEFLPALE
mgnify:CR=1 FL=1